MVREGVAKVVRMQTVAVHWWVERACASVAQLLHVEGPCRAEAAPHAQEGCQGRQGRRRGFRSGGDS